MCVCVRAITGLLAELGGVQVGDELLQTLLVAVHLPVSSHEEPPKRHGGAACGWYPERRASCCCCCCWGPQFRFRCWREQAGCQVVSELSEANGNGIMRRPRLLLPFWISQMRSAYVALCYHLLVKIMNRGEVGNPQLYCPKVLELRFINTITPTTSTLNNFTHTLNSFICLYGLTVPMAL